MRIRRLPAARAAWLAAGATALILATAGGVPTGATAPADERSTPASTRPASGPGLDAEDHAHRRALADWVAGQRHVILMELQGLLSLPNTAGQPGHMEGNATVLRGMLEARGMKVRFLDSPSGPYIVGHLPAEGARGGRPPLRLLFYCHYDGQPVDPARWTVGAPFTPTLRGDPDDLDARIYARSASDDKGPIVALLAAMDGLRAAGIPPSVEVKLLLDPEEEIGSPNLEAALAGHADLLAADLLIFADGPVHQSGRPTVVFGTRGIITVSLTAYGPAEPLHSGHYGNWAPNPAEKLAALLASMKDADGRVLVEGFYDDVQPLSDSERQALAQVPAVEPALKERLLIARPDGGGATLQELINLPSLNVRGLASAWTGGDARTIVPATATAELDLRLVKDIDPLAQVERIRAHARRQGFHVVADEPTPEVRRAHPHVLRLTHGPGTRAARTPLDTPLSRALVTAVRRAAGAEPVLLPTLGGTGPLSRLEALLGMPVYGVPIVNPDNNQHSPDENLRLGNLWDGIVVYASLLRFPAPTSP